MTTNNITNTNNNNSSNASTTTTTTSTNTNLNMNSSSKVNHNNIMTTNTTANICHQNADVSFNGAKKLSNSISNENIIKNIAISTQKLPSTINNRSQITSNNNDCNKQIPSQRSRTKKRLNKKQYDELIKFYTLVSYYPKSKQLNFLADKLGLSLKFIQNWFANRRRRDNLDRSVCKRKIINCKLNKIQKDALNALFCKNPYATQDEMKELAIKYDLDYGAVSRWLNIKRSTNEKLLNNRSSSSSSQNNNANELNSNSSSTSSHNENINYSRNGLINECDNYSSHNDDATTTISSERATPMHNRYNDMDREHHGHSHSHHSVADDEDDYIDDDEENADIDIDTHDNDDNSQHINTTKTNTSKLETSTSEFNKYDVKIEYSYSE